MFSEEVFSILYLCLVVVAPEGYEQYGFFTVSTLSTPTPTQEDETMTTPIETPISTMRRYYYTGYQGMLTIKETMPFIPDLVKLSTESLPITVRPDKNIELYGVSAFFKDRSFERELQQLRKKGPSKMLKGIKAKIRKYHFQNYTDIKEVIRHLRLLELCSSGYAKMGFLRDPWEGNIFSRTVSGQLIPYIKISEPPMFRTAIPQEENDDGHNKRSIAVVVSGIHGRDWMTVHAAMYMATYFVTSLDRDKLRGFDWWIIPILNPDGYINSNFRRGLRDYSWNINQDGECWGVDLDRNFMHQRDRCRENEKVSNCEEYPGQHPFSEAESRALRDFLMPHAKHCKVFVALKEGAKALVYPFASEKTPPYSVLTVFQDLLCVEALEAFDEKHSDQKNLFLFGNSGSIFGASGGYVEDWARKHVGIPRSFALYIAYHGEQERQPEKRTKEFGRASLAALQTLASGHRTERYEESFHDLIKRKKKRKKKTQYMRTTPTPELDTPVPWGREPMPRRLRIKINRGVDLILPEELELAETSM